MKPKIAISGATGLIGSALAHYYKEKDWDVVSFKMSGIELAKLEGCQAVIHLAGESILGRWTELKKKRILESREEGTKQLCALLCQLNTPPQVLIVASAVGYYGNRGHAILTEQSEKGAGFLADTCEKWEEATREAATQGMRVINLRLGIVLSEKGGILQKIVPLFKWGLGAQFGCGSQYISWIDIEDLKRIIDFVIHQTWMAGPINVVSPNPITNREMTKILSKVLHRPTLFTIPNWMIEFLFGQSGKELFLNSMRAIPKKLQDNHFQFSTPGFEDSLIKNVKDAF